MRLLFFLCGFLRCMVPLSSATDFFELCRSEKIVLRRVTLDEKKNEITFICTLQTGKLLLARAEEKKIPIGVKKQGGLPHIFKKIRQRPGILCGIFAGVAFLLLSRLFVWEIRFMGDITLPESELRQELSLAGLSVGRFLPALETEEIALSLRQGDPRIAYVAVNLRGTVATVQIREAESEPIPISGKPANLVAMRDGVITEPLAFTGDCLVREGDVVRKGQVLVSGIRETENNGTIYTRASGQILAKTVREYRVYAPFDTEEKNYTGETGKEIYVLFFGLRGKVFKNTGKLSENYDIIKTMKWLPAGNGKYLPFGYDISSGSEYVWTVRHRDARETVEAAQAEMEALIAAECEQSKVLERKTETVTDERGITLICTLICEEDIAGTVEFSVMQNLPGGN